jgi:hypothetical protein
MHIRRVAAILIEKLPTMVVSNLKFVQLIAARFHSQCRS